MASSADAHNAVARVRNRKGNPTRGSIELLNAYTSTAYLRIEVPLPIKRVLAYRNVILHFLTDKEYPATSFGQFLAGEHVSKKIQKFGYVGFTAMFMLLNAAFFSSSTHSNATTNSFPIAFALSFFLVEILRFEVCRRTNQIFYFLQDFSLIVTIMSLISVSARTPGAMYKATFMMAAALPAFKLAFFPEEFAMTFAQPQSGARKVKMLSMTSNFLRTIGPLFLYQNDLYQKQANNPQIYHLVLPNSAMLPQSGAQVAQQYFLLPIGIYLGLTIMKLVIDEIFAAKALYPRHFFKAMTNAQARADSYPTEMKELFKYNVSHANTVFPRKELIEVLKSAEIINPKERFSPEREGKYHMIIVGLFESIKFSLFIAMLPVGFLGLAINGHVVLKAEMGVFLLVTAYNAASMFIDEPAVNSYKLVAEGENLDEADETETATTWVESEEGDEGGDDLKRPERQPYEFISLPAPGEIDSPAPVPVIGTGKLMAKQDSIDKDI